MGTDGLMGDLPGFMALRWQGSAGLASDVDVPLR
ncbi:hypothetical protein BJY14_003881 [Actinomadura luteofluorescens]|uniref:Uncharacterized protein n=1 Tax=Actinomadura luteofluorescens TaxID=46163 RepID=A0A7Y9EHK3_9ACTN|nr:hypothetical protein [Actinomadura luteofluorescens]